MSDEDHLDKIIEGDNIQNRSEKFLTNISKFEEGILEILYKADNTLTLEEIKSIARTKEQYGKYVSEDEIHPTLKEFSERQVVAIRQPNYAEEKHYSIDPENENVLSDLEEVPSTADKNKGRINEL